MSSKPDDTLVAALAALADTPDAPGKTPASSKALPRTQVLRSRLPEAAIFTGIETP
ncbi:hypothetical protein [Streptomyces sp. NPDC002187]|uniref:hypothetical protein n=1 Tax=Streptomyces sp. NPDC002187 TaxID=3364637 RepID=UPI00369585B9